MYHKRKFIRQEMRIILFCSAVFGFRLEREDASEFLSRSSRYYEISADFEASCIEEHCDAVKFFEVEFFVKHFKVKIPDDAP